MAEQFEQDAPTRLNKYLALHLGVSRREADELIERGSVVLNGTKAQLGARTTHGDTLLVDNKPVLGTTIYQYILLHKPPGYVSSRRPQGDHPTIYALLPTEYHVLKPVGRLDQDSSGLLLLTNDGDFAYQMTHPKFQKAKVYQVKLDHVLAPLHQQMISDHGITLEDGVSTFTISRLDHEASSDSSELFEIVMHGGRNRQIRRTFAALGYTVTHLHRVQFGTFSIGTLQPGEYEETTISG